MKYLYALGWGSVAGIVGCFFLGSPAGMVTFTALLLAGLGLAKLVEINRG